MGLICIVIYDVGTLNSIITPDSRTLTINFDINIVYKIFINAVANCDLRHKFKKKSQDVCTVNLCYMINDIP